MDFSLDHEKLKKIFGYEPKIDILCGIGNIIFEPRGMVELTGVFHRIIGRDEHGDRIYTIATSSFSKVIDSDLIKGDAFFEGPWDEVGKKLANLFFANHRDGSAIFLNDKQCRILKREDGSIDIV